MAPTRSEKSALADFLLVCVCIKKIGKEREREANRCRVNCKKAGGEERKEGSQWLCVVWEKKREEGEGPTNSATFSPTVF